MSHGHGIKPFTEQDVNLPQKGLWRSLPKISGAIGLLFLIITIALAATAGDGGAQRQYFSYLVAFMYFLSIALGGLFFVVIQYTTRAGWSVVVRRIAENFMATLPLFALLFIPIALNVETIFSEWVHPHGHHKTLIEKKAGYLNISFFMVRAVVFLAIWSALAWWFRKMSVAQDKTGDHELTKKMQLWSPIGIALFALTSTFAAFDWIMSLDPAWFSTIFGVYFFAGSVVAILASMIVVVILLRRSGALRGVVTTEHDHDLGKLLFGFTVFWTYIAFSQFFLIWYANIPEETMWYYHRTLGSWGTVSTILFVCHFIIPFFFLLSHHTKRRPATLLFGAIWMLVVHYIDLYWLIMPTTDHAVHFQAADITAMIGVGGLFVAAFGYWSGRDALIPVKDPRLSESRGHQNYPATKTSAAEL